MASENSDYAYVGVVNPNLICCLCTLPFEAPVSTPCAHTFCRGCLDRCSGLCPIDRTPFSRDDIRPAPVIIRNMVDELLVRCACSEVHQRQNADSHRKASCSHALVMCGCGEALLKRDMDGHLRHCEHRLISCKTCEAKMKALEAEDHVLACPEAPTSCPDCSRSLPRSSMSAHRSACLLGEASCPQFSHGCTWTGPRVKLESHLEGCSYEAIKGFFSIYESRFAAEQALRRDAERTMDSLKMQTQTLGRQLGEAKARVASLEEALGASFLPQLQTSRPPVNLRLPVVRRRSLPSSHLLQPSPAVFPPEDSSIFPSLPSLHGSAHTGHHLHPHPHPHPSSSPSAISSPLPPPMHRHSGFLLSTLHNPRVLGGGVSQSLPHDGLTHPLDPEDIVFPPPTEDEPSVRSPLERSVGSIVETLTALVHTVEALERKSDLMLTAETLRLMEEIGALRSMTHSIRMQLYHLSTGQSALSPTNQRFKSHSTSTSSIHHAHAHAEPDKSSLAVSATAYATTSSVETPRSSSRLGMFDTRGGGMDRAHHRL